jgi:hypothetical protein
MMSHPKLPSESMELLILLLSADNPLQNHEKKGTTLAGCRLDTSDTKMFDLVNYINNAVTNR